MFYKFEWKSNERNHLKKNNESDAGKQYGMNNEWIQIYIEKSIWVKKNIPK